MTERDDTHHSASQDPHRERFETGTPGWDGVEPTGTSVQSGSADFVATNTGGVSAEHRNPLPEEEQGRGTEYDAADQGPQREG